MARTPRTTLDADVIGVERVSTSRMGNPSYRLVCADGRTHVTAANADCGYGATNYRPGHDAPPTPVTLTLNARGRVIGIDRRAPAIAEVFLQWKNTNVCLDFTCGCGADGHFDGYFAHILRCPVCGAFYEMPAVLSIPASQPSDAHRAVEPDLDEPEA